MHVVTMVTHGLGDVAMAVPLMRAVGRATLAQTAIVRTQAAADLVRLAVPNIEDVLCFDTSQPRALFALLRWFHRRQPLALLMPHNSSGMATQVFARCSGIPIRVGPAGVMSRCGFTHTVTPGQGEHKVEYYLRFGAPLGAKGDPMDGRLHTVGCSRGAEGRIVLAPGSGRREAHKRWPMQRFVELIAQLQLRAPTCELVFVGTEDERDLLSSVEKSTQFGDRVRVNIVKGIDESIRVLEGASCVVSGCSGTAHLAAAMGIPVVGIYGPTNPFYTAPYGTELVVVRSDLKCAPCYRKGFVEGCGNPLCMEQITADAVLPHVLAHCRS